MYAGPVLAPGETARASQAQLHGDGLDARRVEAVKMDVGWRAVIHAELSGLSVPGTNKAYGRIGSLLSLLPKLPMTLAEDRDACKAAVERFDALKAKIDEEIAALTPAAREVYTQ